MIKTYPYASDVVDDVIESDCELCDDMAVRTVRIEYNQTASDDDVFDVCFAHYKAAHVDAKAFVMAYVQLTVEEVDDDET